MGIIELSELIIYVDDMAGQVSFYRDVLGLEVTYPRDVKDFQKEMWVTFATGRCTLALHGGGQRCFGDDAPKFVFAVDDIDSERQRLANLEVEIGEAFKAAPGVRVVNGKDPEGNKFSLEEGSH